MMLKGLIRFFSRLLAYPIFFLVVCSYLAAKFGYLKIEWKDELGQDEAKLDTVRDYLRHELIETATFCHIIASDSIENSSIKCHVGFDYNERVIDEKMKNVADEFREILRKMAETTGKFAETVASPLYSIKFLKSRLDVPPSWESKPIDPSALNPVMTLHVNFVEKFLKTLERRLELHTKTLKSESNSPMIFDEDEIVNAQQDSLIKVLGDIKSSVNSEDSKLAQKLLDLQKKSEALPTALYSAISDYCLKILNGAA